MTRAIVILALFAMGVMNVGCGAHDIASTKQARDDAARIDSAIYTGCMSRPDIAAHVQKDFSNNYAATNRYCSHIGQAARHDRLRELGFDPMEVAIDTCPSEGCFYTKDNMRAHFTAWFAAFNAEEACTKYSTDWQEISACMNVAWRSTYDAKAKELGLKLFSASK